MCMFYVNVYIYIYTIHTRTSPSYGIFVYICVYRLPYPVKRYDTILKSSFIAYTPLSIGFQFMLFNWSCPEYDLFHLSHASGMPDTRHTASLSLSDAKSTKCISIVMPRRLGLCIRYECTYAFLPHTTSTYIIHTVDSSHKSTFIRLAIT